MRIWRGAHRSRRRGQWYRTSVPAPERVALPWGRTLLSVAGAVDDRRNGRRRSVTNDPASDNSRALVPETQAIWDEKAAFWDERMGEGNAFQQVLIGPASERLLAVRPNELILDVACGNGVFARRLAQLGAQVVATDFSARFLELARAR